MATHKNRVCSNKPFWFIPLWLNKIISTTMATTTAAMVKFCFFFLSTSHTFYSCFLDFLWRTFFWSFLHIKTYNLKKKTHYAYIFYSFSHMNVINIFFSCVPPRRRDHIYLSYFVFALFFNAFPYVYVLNPLMRHINNKRRKKNTPEK